MNDIDPFLICQYKKHQGELWTDVVKNDHPYVLWLVSGEGPSSIDRIPGLYDYLMDLCEDHEDVFGDN